MLTQEQIAALEALLAMAKGAPASTPKLEPMPPKLANREITLGDVIASYLTEDGRFFARDFWVEGLIGAQAGASVQVYNLVNIRSPFTTGENPKHNKIVGPFDPTKMPNQMVTTAGTIGWIPAGLTYQWDSSKSDPENARAWIAAGAPYKNAFGEWGDLGVPLDLQAWRRLHPSERLPGEIPHKGKGHKDR